jgi:hypothetical protein
MNPAPAILGNETCFTAWIVVIMIAPEESKNPGLVAALP